VGVRGGAAAEETEGLGGGDLMPGARGNKDGIAWGDELVYSIYFHVSGAFENEVKFFTELVVMALRGMADGYGGLGERLILHRGVGQVQEAADAAAVFGGEGNLFRKWVDGHADARMVCLCTRRASFHMNFDIHHCSALITGASSGLGAEFSRQLAPQAEALFITGRRLEALEAVKAECLGLNGALTVHLFACDISTEQGREDLLQQMGAVGFQPNLLINNAGMGDYGSVATATAEKLKAQMELNMTALVLLTHGCLPLLKRPGGILNISSLASALPLPAMAVYAASKAFVTSFSEALAVELEREGVAVTCVCPGPTPTGFGKTAQRPNGEDTDRDGQALLRISPQQVVAEALAALHAGHTCVYPGMGVKIAFRLFRHLPRILLRPLLRRRYAKGTV
jgi:short-subunit dehydrogenase